MDSGAPGQGRSRAGPHAAGLLLAVALLLPAAPLGPVCAQGSAAPAAPAPRPAAKPDPAFEAAKAAFEALPEAERRAVQDALVWTGDFNAVVSGSFGRRTFEALEAYRARTGAGDPLEPRARVALLAAGEAARQAARFRIAADPGSGVVLGVPERLLARRTALPAGSRWQSADGRVTLETRAYPPGGETLESLFERATAPLADRKVTYKLRRPDFLVVTAETGTGLSYIRYAAGPQGVRGFLLGYDRALAREVDRLVIAVANAFEPFPAAPPSAPTAPSSAAPAPAATPAPAPRAALAGTGLAVAPGRVLTAASVLEGCPAPRIGSGPARLVASDRTGLALLEAAGAPAPAPPAPRSGPMAAEESLIALAAGPDGASAAPGLAVADGLVAALQPGSAGAPVLDRSGRLAGLVARYPEAPRLVAGVVPPARVGLVKATEVAAFLAGQGIALPAAPRAGGPGGLVPGIVGILCR